MTASDLRTTLIVYRRPDCQLCDDAEQMLHDELERRSRDGLATPAVEWIDITTNAGLQIRYAERLPVFAIGADEVDIVIRSHQIRDLLDRAMPPPA